MSFDQAYILCFNFSFFFPFALHQPGTRRGHQESQQTDPGSKAWVYALLRETLHLMNIERLLRQISDPFAKQFTRLNGKLEKTATDDVVTS